MSKDVWYRQCELTLKTNTGKKVDIAWIPENLAKIGKTVYFGEKDSINELWTVEYVGGRKNGKWLIEHQMDYKHQRKMSDI